MLVSMREPSDASSRVGSSRRLSIASGCAVALGLALLASCTGERRRVPRQPARPGVEEPGDTSVPAPLPRDAGVAGPSTRPPDLCSSDALINRSREIRFEAVDTVDVLFAIDDSSTMAQEQAELANQLPRLVDGLAGFLSETAIPVRSAHVAVVSGDLGLAGVEGVTGCTGLGKDGVLQQRSSQRELCPLALPAFLAFTPGSPERAGSIEGELFCMAQLGTNGCDVQQPLEAALKALWPSTDDRVTFVGADGAGERGHGDTHNAGFLRSTDGPERSLLAIVLVSDKDDCSLRDPRAWADGQGFAAGDVLRHAGSLNARCAFDHSPLFEVSRYVSAFESLRPDQERLLLFDAITGVPRLTGVRAGQLDESDEVARAEFYSRLLRDPAMQITTDDRGNDSPADDGLAAACNSGRGTATPAVRLVELAQAFGANGMVHSICDSDFGETLDAIAGRIQTRLGGPCLPNPLSRSANGLLPCELIWSLPRPEQALAGTPSACGEPGFSFLLPIRAGSQAQTTGRGELCRMAQLEVRARDGQLVTVPTETDGELFEQGWFYDDFSSDALRQCPSRPRRVAFSPGAEPPSDVRVTLDCDSDALRDLGLCVGSR